MKRVPAHMMTTAERLDEIAAIMANAVIRQEKRNKTNEFGEGSSGLHCLPERPCHATEAKEKA